MCFKSGEETALEQFLFNFLLSFSLSLFLGDLHTPFPLVDFVGGPHLCLSQFLTFPLFLPQVHAVGRKCLQVLLFLQSNSGFIFSTSELPRKEFPCGPIVVLFACYLYMRKMLKSEASSPSWGNCPQKMPQEVLPPQ